METAQVLYLKPEKYCDIEIDRTKDKNLSDQAKKLLNDYYQTKEELSPQQAYARAAIAYSYGDIELAQRIYNYVSDGWFMYASPVLSNAPMPDACHPEEQVLPPEPLSIAPVCEAPPPFSLFSQMIGFSSGMLQHNELIIHSAPRQRTRQPSSLQSNSSNPACLPFMVGTTL